MTSPRYSRRLASLGLLAAALAVWVAVLRPQALGGSALYIVVRGSSMLPTYQNGDLVVVESAAAYAVGDIVAYRVPNGDIGEGHLVIHRITGGDGAVGFAVQGDNNERSTHGRRVSAILPAALGLWSQASDASSPSSINRSSPAGSRPP